MLNATEALFDTIAALATRGTVLMLHLQTIVNDILFEYLVNYKT